MSNVNHTLVIIGNDPSFAIDLSAFRGVREETGMKFSRLKNPTESQLERHLLRLRMQYLGKLPNLHIAAHMGPDGIELSDGKINPERVSELIQGSSNVFLAGCESIEISDALSSVGNVLSVLEEINNDQALAFSLIFWMGIGYGHSARTAFDMASENFPAISEYSFLRTNDFLSQRMIPE